VPVCPIALNDGEGCSNKNGTAASPCENVLFVIKRNEKKLRKRTVVFITLPE
jgi:hypothetical protein